jgi:YggT family protein
MKQLSPKNFYVKINYYLFSKVIMFLLPVAGLLFWVFFLMLFARILGSWIPEIQNNRLMLFIAFYTDPYLHLFRRIIPPLGMIDLSPIVAFLCLGVIEQIVKALIVFLFR